MSCLRNVAVVGGTGYLGKFLVSKLVEARIFDIRIVTRDSSKLAPTGTTIVSIDYSDPETLVKAFEGCDVVVSALGNRQSQEHFTVLDAAIAGHVPRIVPSIWSGISHSQTLNTVPFIKRKLDVMEAVEKAAMEDKITYTAFTGGAWIEYVMEFPTLLCVPERTFYMPENPDLEIGLSGGDCFGDALLVALQKPEETKNVILNIERVRVSASRALLLVKDALPGEQFTVVHAPTEERFKKGMEAMLAGATDRHTWANILSKLIFNPGEDPMLGIPGNELLGIKAMTHDEFKDILKEIANTKRW